MPTKRHWKKAGVFDARELSTVLDHQFLKCDCPLPAGIVDIKAQESWHTILLNPSFETFYPAGNGKQDDLRNIWLNLYGKNDKGGVTIIVPLLNTGYPPPWLDFGALFELVQWLGDESKCSDDDAELFGQLCGRIRIVFTAIAQGDESPDHLSLIRQLNRTYSIYSIGLYIRGCTSMDVEDVITWARTKTDAEIAAGRWPKKYMDLFQRQTVLILGIPMVEPFTSLPYEGDDEVYRYNLILGFDLGSRTLHSRAERTRSCIMIEHAKRIIGAARRPRRPHIYTLSEWALHEITQDIADKPMTFDKFITWLFLVDHATNGAHPGRRKGITFTNHDEMLTAALRRAKLRTPITEPQYPHIKT